MSGCPHVDRKNRRCIRSFHMWGAHVYGNIPKVGAKKIRETVAEGLFREAVKERAQGMCDARFAVTPAGGYVCSGAHHAGEHAHHLHPEDRDVGFHDPGRGIFVCWVAHAWIHDNPDAARVLGLLRPEPSDAA